MSWSLRTARPDDHARVTAAVDAWWGGREVAALLQPLFLENFSSTSLVAESDDGQLVGFLVGFESVDDPRVAYVHFVGVAPGIRTAGLGRRLYQCFCEQMAARGVRRVRCVTSVVNTASVAFHQAIGFHVAGYKPDARVDGGRYVQLERELPATPSPVRRSATWPPSPETVLRGDVVEIRPTAVDDSAELFDALDHEVVWRHLTTPRPQSPEEMRVAVERAVSSMFPWTVRLLEPLRDLPVGTVVGWSSYLEVSVPDARLEVGSTAYTPAVWASSVNPETKLLLLGHAFDALGFGRVQLKTDVRNTRSQDAIARLGAVREGVLRRYQRRLDGSVRDTVLFSITDDEWPAVRVRLESRLQRGSA